MTRYIIRRNGIPQFVDRDMNPRDVASDDDASCYRSRTGAESLCDTFSRNGQVAGITLGSLRAAIRNLGRGPSVWEVQEVEV